MTQSLQVAVVGGGIGGLTAAIALRARGAKVMVFEQAEKLREIGAWQSESCSSHRYRECSLRVVTQPSSVCPDDLKSNNHD
jgi:2-polyprenyl-6-methoxyphenol hydroxylase-like FAD-dependent oxidoreductase